MTSKQKNAVNMLNYIMTITQEINNSKESRLYLESAYSSLINNSDPGLIDTRTQERITNILDTLEQYRMIAEKERGYDIFMNKIVHRHFVRQYQILLDCLVQFHLEIF